MKYALMAIGLLNGLILSQAHADTIYLDVRSSNEYQQDHMANSVHIPHRQISEKANHLLPNKDDTIYVFCAAGVRAEHAKHALNKLGYNKVINLKNLKNARQHVNAE